MLRVFENKVLRRPFGPSREDVMGDRRKLHNKEVHDIRVVLTKYYKRDQIKAWRR
jgi:hypothetical protein